MEWTVEQVEELAPDAASIKAARKLTSPGKWGELGHSDELLWGQCHGSATYDVTVELESVGYKCSCPSRKFPCKHVLALLSLLAGGQVDKATAPAWAADWLAARQQKAAKKAEAAANPAKKKPVDEKARAKRQAARESKVDGGLAMLETVLSDLVRTGLAEAEGRGFRFWNDTARRLVDSQAPTLAGWVRSLGDIPGSGEDWPARLLEQLGRIQLLIDAYRNPTLPEPLRDEVRMHIGFPLPADELARRGTTLTDDWALLGQTREELTNLVVRRTWVQGQQSGRTALVLDFGVAQSPLKPLPTGRVLSAVGTLYPGATQQRIKLQEPTATASLTQRPVSHATFADMLAESSRLRAADPWLLQTAALVSEVRLVPSTFVPESLLPKPLQAKERETKRASVRRKLETPWYAVDRDGRGLPLVGRDWWKLLALVGDGPADLIAEFDGTALTPLAIWPSSPEVAGWCPV